MESKNRIEGNGTIFIDRGPLSNEALCAEMDNETDRIRFTLRELGYYVQNIIFRTKGHPCLIIEARAWQDGDEANISGV